MSPKNANQAYEKNQFMDRVAKERMDLLDVCGKAQGRFEEVFGPL